MEDKNKQMMKWEMISGADFMETLALGLGLSMLLVLVLNLRIVPGTKGVKVRREGVLGG